MLRSSCEERKQWDEEEWVGERLEDEYSFC